METKAGFADKYFLEKVELSGYRSIRQTEIEFKNNFSVIIGKNGSGKTNFLKLLDRIINKDVEGIYNYDCTLNFSGAESIQLNTKNIFSESNSEKQFVPDDGLLFTSVIGEQTKQYKVSDYFTLFSTLQDKNFVTNSTLIKHGIPHNYILIDKIFEFVFDVIGKPFSLAELISLKEPYFINNLLANTFFDANNTETLSNWDMILQEEIKSRFKKYISGFINALVSSVQRLTPISNVRLSNNFNISSNNQKVKVSNLYFEFEVEDEWYLFSDLSDGTKRMFYVISEIVSNESFFFRPERFGINSKGYSRIILIEEPELGIHPHQLRKLMLFLKEQSKTKQIIITTHSPEVLDILEPDELDSIILSYYDKENGTRLRHLTDKEKEKAQAYIQEEFLSDYWMHSNLEPAN